MHIQFNIIRSQLHVTVSLQYMELKGGPLHNASERSVKEIES